MVVEPKMVAGAVSAATVRWPAVAIRGLGLNLGLGFIWNGEEEDGGVFWSRKI